MLNYGCNFDCEECFLKRDERTAIEAEIKRRPSPSRLREMLKPFAPSVINMTGFGEPLLYPQIARVCSELAQDHLIKLTTNLSLARFVRTILDNVETRRIFSFNVSLHVEELLKHNKVPVFWESIKMLEAAGVPRYAMVNVKTNHHPKLRDFVSRLGNEHGMVVFGKFTQGSTMPAIGIGHREYEFAKSIGVNMMFFHPCAIGTKLYPRASCRAGKDVFNIDLRDGNISKCVPIRRSMGNVFGGKFNPKVPAGCMPMCFCHPYLFLPNFSDAFNNWPEFYGLTKPNVEFPC